MKTDVGLSQTRSTVPGLINTGEEVTFILGSSADERDVQTVPAVPVDETTSILNVRIVAQPYPPARSIITIR